MRIVKKYSNRRLYDTAESRYITLEDLADRIREGAEVRVQDAQDGSDITQVTLTQIILEARGGARLLPVPLLVQLIRLGDDALAEFFGRYVSWALSVYVQARQVLPPLGPIASAPFAATNAFARMVGPMWGGFGGPQPPVPAAYPDLPPPPEAERPASEEPPAPGRGDARDDIASLRRELEELKRLAGGTSKHARAAATRSGAKGKTGATRAKKAKKTDKADGARRPPKKP